MRGASSAYSGMETKNACRNCVSGERARPAATVETTSASRTRMQCALPMMGANSMTLMMAPMNSVATIGRSRHSGRRGRIHARSYKLPAMAGSPAPSLHASECMT